jgi:hypothetical protein
MLPEYWQPDIAGRRTDESSLDDSAERLTNTAAIAQLQKPCPFSHGAGLLCFYVFNLLG